MWKPWFERGSPPFATVIKSLTPPPFLVFHLYKMALRLLRCKCFQKLTGYGLFFKCQDKRAHVLYWYYLEHKGIALQQLDPLILSRFIYYNSC